jgi:hypothetical protein
MTENSIREEIEKLCSHIKVIMDEIEKLEKTDILTSRKCENKIVEALRQYRPLGNINFIVSHEEIEKEAKAIKMQSNNNKKIVSSIKKKIAIFDTNTLCGHISYCMKILTELEITDIALSRKFARKIMNTLMEYSFFKTINFSMIEENLLEDMQTLYMQEQAKLTLSKGDNNVKEK